LTPVAETLKVAVVDPEGTVTEAGTVAAGLLLARATAVPEAPAGPDRVTEPVEVLPPVSNVGLSVTDSKAAGLMVRVPVLVWPLRLAEIVTGSCALTPVVVTVKVADV
jgi:hypothetical protein